MRALLLEDVIADWCDFNDNTRILTLLFFNDRDDIRRDIRLDADGIEATVTSYLFLDIFDRYLEQVRKALNDIIRDRCRQRQQRHRKSRTIRDEQFPIPVIERPARCHCRHDADAVAVCQARIILTLIDLQVGGSSDKHGDDQD